MLSEIKHKVSDFFSSSGFKKYFLNTGWLLGERVVTMGVAFVVGALVARYLGADGMGVIAYALSLSGFVDVFIVLGTKGVLTRELVLHPEEANSLLGSTLALRGIGGIISIAIILGVILFLPHDTNTIIVIVIIMASVIVRGGDVVFNLLESKVITKYDAKIKLVSLVLVSLFKIALIFIFEANLMWFAISYLLLELINLSGQGYLYYKLGLGDIRKWKVKRSYIKRIFSSSWPLVFTALVTAIYMQTDQIMIKHMLTEADTGVYFISNKFAKIFLFIPTILSTSLATAVYNAKKEGHEKFIQRMQNLMDLLVLLSFTIVLGVILVGPFLIDNIYGPEFEKSGEVLLVHAWTLLFIAIGGGSSTYLLAMNLEKMAFIRTGIAALVNVVLNYFMIPYFGVMGAAYATLITQIIGSYFAYLTSPKTLEIFKIQTNSLFLISPIKKLIHFSRHDRI